MEVGVIVFVASQIVKHCSPNRRVRLEILLVEDAVLDASEVVKSRDYGLVLAHIDFARA